MSLAELPQNLPIPVDDGAARHLEGMVLPDLTFKTTSGDSVAIGLIGGLLVIYIYPMTGRPDVPQPDGWEQIPGARGFTAQSCSFRDHHQELQALKTEVYGLSSQTSAYQLEAKERLHLPFNLLSDSAFELKNSLSLPTFEAEGMELYKRLTLIAKDGKIEKVFYPVFPPDQNANDVLSWLQDNT